MLGKVIKITVNNCREGYLVKTNVLNSSSESSISNSLCFAWHLDLTQQNFPFSSQKSTKMHTNDLQILKSYLPVILKEGLMVKSIYLMIEEM